MNAEELGSSIVLLKAAGYRIRDEENYKALLLTMFGHLPADLWNKATKEVLENSRAAYLPKPVEWKEYVRIAYDKMPKIGKDEPKSKVAEPEHFMEPPSERHVAAWRKMFGGPINFDQAPQLVLEEIMAAKRTGTLRISKLASFFGFIPERPERGVEMACLSVVNPAPSPRSVQRKNELVRALIEAPSTVREAEREPAAVVTPAEGSSPSSQPLEYSEEDLSDVPF